MSELRGEKSEEKEGKHFFVACVMIVRWHRASQQFLDARVFSEMVDTFHMKNITCCS